MKKKLFSLLAVLALVFCLVGCNVEILPDPEPQPQPTEAAKITDGYFTYSYSVEGHGAQNYFIHFYENGIFYFSGLNGGGLLVGRYEVKEEAWEGTYHLDRNAAAPPAGQDKVFTNGTAPATVKFFDLSGTEIGKSGLDLANGKLYDLDCQGQPAYCQKLLFHHDLEFKPSSSTGLENGVALYTYEDPDDDANSLSINHDGSSTDEIGSQIKGTWTVSADGKTYTLVKKGQTDAYATLVVSDDGKTAVYKASGKADVNLVLHEDPLILEEIFEGNTKYSHPQAGELDVAISLELYTNGKAIAFLKAPSVGMTLQIEGGTWGKDDAGAIQMISIGGESYSQPTAGAVPTEKNLVNGKFTPTLKFPSQSGGTIDFTVELTQVLELIKVEDEGSYISFSSDFTFELNAVGGRIACTGTWYMRDENLVLEYSAQDFSLTPTVNSTTNDLEIELVAGGGALTKIFTVEKDDWTEKLQNKVPEVLRVTAKEDDYIVFYSDFVFTFKTGSGRVTGSGNWSMPEDELLIEFENPQIAVEVGEDDKNPENTGVLIIAGGSPIRTYSITPGDLESKLQGKAPAQD